MKKPKAISLQDQLLKAGLASDAKAKQVKAEKRKQTKLQRNNGVDVIDEAKVSAEQARRQQVERDRELNQQRKQADEQKALAAQIKQLVQLNRIAQDDGGKAYRFSHDGKVKSIYVADQVRDALVNGRVAIVLAGQAYEIVPAEIARKIEQREPACVIVLNQPSQDLPEADDPYADYQIPDDLMW